MRKIALVVYFCVLSCNCLFAKKTEKINTQPEHVAAQLNYCVNALTNIIENESIEVLETEIDQMVNNLTQEQVVGMDFISEFRIRILNCAESIRINEEERKILRKVQSIKKDNLMMQSISNALNPAMLLTGGGSIGPQMIFQAFITVARTAVEYKSSSNQLDMEELQSMWQIRKQNMGEIRNLRMEALDLTSKLYNKYNLKEYDRLTEETAKEFNNIISTPDLLQRARKLVDNKNKFGHLNEYNYYLGMSYIDDTVKYGGAKGYKIAEQYFDKYLKTYRKYPLLRTDGMSGAIALAKLTYKDKISKKEKLTLIDEVLKNLPNNGAALMQCALIYLIDLDQPKKAYDLLRSAIDNENMTNKNEIIFMAAKLMDRIKAFPDVYDDFCRAVYLAKDINLESYLSFVINSDNNETCSQVEQVIGLEVATGWVDAVQNSWYTNFTAPRENISFWNRLWKSTPTSIYIGITGVSLDALNEALSEIEFNLTLPEEYTLNFENLSVYLERIQNDNLIITQYEPIIRDGIKRKDILNDIKEFKDNSPLMTYFVESIIGNEIYRVKSDLNYTKILDNEIPYLHSLYPTGEASTINKLRKKIVKYCQNHQPKKREIVADYKFIDEERCEKEATTKVAFLDLACISKEGEQSKLDISRYDKDMQGELRFDQLFVGERLNYTPKILKQQQGNFLKLVFAGSENLVLTYAMSEDGFKIFSMESDGMIYYSLPQTLAK